MIRRDFIKFIIASLASHPLAATAQRSIPVIGALSAAARPAQFDSTVYDGFLQGMRELGYVEGKDYLIEWRFADGDYARLPELANELVGLKVNVLFAASTAAIQAAHKVTTTIPIVMGFYEDDPTGDGLAASFGHPAGNVTGLAAMAVETVSKPLDLARAILPDLNRLGVLVNPSLGSFRTSLVNLQASAEKVGMTVLVWEAQRPQDIETAFNAMGQTNNLGAIILISEAFFFAKRRHIAELSLNNRLPLIVAGPREYALAGALVSYGANLSDLFRRSATYVDKILKGAKPGDLPIEQSTRFDLAINLKTAKALGLSVPPSMLAIADEAIE
jgi:putative tryptophan/tyrosine transport system substrate-binding protein